MEVRTQKTKTSAADRVQNARVKPQQRGIATESKCFVEQQPVPRRTTGKSHRVESGKPSGDPFPSVVEPPKAAITDPLQTTALRRRRRVPLKGLPALADLEAMETGDLRKLALALSGRIDAGRMSRELLLRAVAWQVQMTAVRDGVANANANSDAACVDAARAVERRCRAVMRSIEQEMAHRGRVGVGDMEANAVAPSQSNDGGGERPVWTGNDAAGTDAPSCARRRPPARKADHLPPGSRLIRQWHGETHEVIVQADGKFLWRGKAWSSLSLIARTITGATWSGPRFFGTIEKGNANGKTIAGR